MEKNLNKYITITAAESEIFITAKMIREMCERQLIPFINDKGEVLVNPADITSYIEEKVFSFKPKVKKKTEPAIETTAEDVLDTPSVEGIG